MFKSVKIITYRASDIEEAKQWYIKVLNTRPLFDTPFTVIFRIGECSLSLSKVHSPVSENIERTEAYWEVDDIDTSYQRLIDLGARVHTPIRDVLNTRMAKVVDPFGNIIGITGLQQADNERTVEKKPSETAMTVAFCRALASKEDREEIKGPDDLAEIFLTDEGRKLLSDSASRKWTIQNLVTSPLYGYFICRTAFIDDIFKKALSEKVFQIVLLGAGYDTRAYRFANLISHTRIFELDAKSTQDRKLDILKNAGIGIPQQVSFISINFKNENFIDALMHSGFDNTLKTLFIWEGVTYYLSKNTVIDTLTLINTHTCKGSMICLDYMTEKIDTVNPAEPFLFWIQPDEMVSLLSGLGFDIIEDIDSTEMGKRYLTLKNGPPAGKILPYFRLLTGTVSNKKVKADLSR